MNALEARATSLRIARAILARGGSGTVAEIAADTGLPPQVVSRRLCSHGPGAMRADFRYYARVDSRWGLTAAGRAFTEELP